ESLRARKHVFDETEFDEIETEADPDGDIEAPVLQPETMPEIKKDA
ncbi:MAG: hypothetical protein IID49_09005, partial [Proteobacteria bacterium]|nr:hypothetical protein [Pseudomonadota bacterium]